MVDASSSLIDYITSILSSSWEKALWLFSQPESVAGLIGAFLAVIVAVASVLMTERGHKKRAMAQEQQELKAFLQGVKTELVCIWGIYQADIGAAIGALSEGEALDAKVSIQQDYFSFFHGNVGILGKLKDNDLRAHIIECYTQAKVLLDCLNINNHMVMKAEEHGVWAAESGKQVHIDSVNHYKTALIEYAIHLKAHDTKLRKIFPTLVKRINESLETGGYF
jgi:hypothetical protein